MGLDIRTPIGLMFLVKGLLLAAYGAYSHASPMYERSLGMNVNLYWGLVLVVFGVIMLVLGKQKSVNTLET